MRESVEQIKICRPFQYARRRDGLVKRLITLITRKIIVNAISHDGDESEEADYR